MRSIGLKIKRFFTLSEWPLEDKLLATLLMLFFIVLLVKTAWLSDDAYITFRTVDNFTHGFGLRWNVLERVQSYTHPLWMLLMSFFSFLTKDIYFTAYVLSITLAVGAIYIGLFKQHKGFKLGALAFLILISSKSFIEYSTSGLENTLLHFILAIFLFLYFAYKGNHRLYLLTLVSSFGMLTRQDTLLLFLPILVYEFFKDKTPIKRRIATVLIGLMPLLLWEAFSLLYYGYFVPNTAFAKLNTNVPMIWYFKQGIKYTIATAAIDPITVIAIATVPLMVFSMRAKNMYPIVIGFALYFLYILRIGGDQMVGRYFSALVFMSAVMLPHLLAQIKLSKTLYPVLFVSLALSSLLSPTPIILSGADYQYYGGLDLLGTHDERGFFFYRTSLLKMKRDMKINAGWAEEGKAYRKAKTRLAIVGNIGYLGYFAGPDVHILDYLALSDPLLSKIKADEEIDWLVGHFRRTIPCGYEESILTNENHLCDKNLALYYDKVRIITRDKPLSWKRFKTIAKMNFGGYNYLIERYEADHPEFYERKTLSQVLEERKNGK